MRAPGATRRDGKLQPGRRALSVLAGVPPLLPGQSDSFAVDLVPARYAIVCFLIASDGTSEALKGMAAEFRVR